MNCAIHNEVPATAYCRTCGKAMCAQCTREVKGVIYCEDCIANSLRQAAPAAVPPQANHATATLSPRSDGPNPTLAGILSAFLPGLGCVYAGEVMRGAMNLLVFAAIIAIHNSVMDTNQGLHIVASLAIAFWYFYQIVDAVRVAKAKAAGTVAQDPFGLYSGAAGRAFRAGRRVLPMGPMFLVVIGFIFLLGNVFSLDVIAKLWPLILIYFGAVRLYDSQQNVTCPCARCRTRSLMGPVVLLTLGVLFLLDSLTHVDFDKTWPLLLIAIGGVKFLQISGSTEGHIGPGEPGSRYNPPPPPATEEQKESQVNHG